MGKVEDARALLNKALELGRLGSGTEAIAVYDDLIIRFRSASEPAVQEDVSKALVDKGFELARLGRDIEAITNYDDLILRFGETVTPSIHENIARALRNKGNALVRLGRGTEAVAAYDDLIARFRSATALSIHEDIATALRSKGYVLGTLGHATEAITVLDDLITRFGSSTIPSIRENAAAGLRSKAAELVRLGRGAEAITVYDDLIARFGFETKLSIHVAVALRYKGSELSRLGRGEEAIAVYGDLIGRYSSSTDPSIQEEVKEARIALDGLMMASVPTATTSTRSEPSMRVFIVHGHDDAACEAVARLVERAGMEAVILREQPKDGRTIIENFEKHSETAGFAVALLTPDDIGGPRGTVPEQLRQRARQNVVAELFFFIGKLGRSRVCALVKGDIELPSDLDGLLYEQMDQAGNWRLALAREMVSAGLPVDLNKTFHR